jgi:hypothetical protein
MSQRDKGPNLACRTMLPSCWERLPTSCFRPCHEAARGRHHRHYEQPHRLISVLQILRRGAGGGGLHITVPKRGAADSPLGMETALITAVIFMGIYIPSQWCQ